MDASFFEIGIGFVVGVNMEIHLALFFKKGNPRPENGTEA
jgi:hypothetical protein